MEEKIEFVNMPAEAAVFEAAPAKVEMRRTFSRMALGLCLGLLVSELVPTVLQSIIPDYDAQAHAFLVGGLCTGLYTLPVVYLLSSPLYDKYSKSITYLLMFLFGVIWVPIIVALYDRIIKKEDCSVGRKALEKHSIGIGRFLALVCISYATMILGNLVGIGINLLLSPGSVDLVANLASASGASVEMVIAFAVLAPVFEELVFRKVIVDRVLPYGEWPAILFSGVTFGLFHGNLTQFFYAALLGMLLAYVYIRTGNILYTIGLHACINCLGGVLPLLFPVLSSLLLIVAVAGVVLFFVLKKHIHVARNAVPGVGRAMFGNVGMILFLLFSGVLMILVAVIMNHPELTGGLL